MQKSDLRSGMIVELRNGNMCVVIGNRLLDSNSYVDFNSYNDDLICCKGKLDIMKIYENDCMCSLEDKADKEKLKLIWQRKKEIDWSGVPFGTRVRVWDSGEKSYEGKFLGYDEEEGYYPFNVFVDVSYDVAWEKCELIEEPKEEKDVTYEEIKKEFDTHCNENRCGNCKYYKENQCEFIYILDNYKVTRKEK